jgi:phospholipid/cholesterol/gamma-HCH transport system substrate-binding protein
MAGPTITTGPEGLNCRMKHDNKRTEILVGVFLLSGMVLLGALILRFSSIRERFRERDRFTVIFSDASGLSAGAPVRLGGTTIGRVEQVPRLTASGKVGVPITVYRDAENQIPRGSRFAIAKEGLLGDSYIAITRPEEITEGFHNPGEQLMGSATTGLDTLQESAGKISTEVESLVKELRQGVKSFDAAVARLNAEVMTAENTENIKNSLASLNSALKKFDEQILSPENTAAVDETLASLRATSDSLASQVKKLDPILTKGEKAMTSFGEAADSFKQSGSAFTKAAEKAGKTFGQATDGDGLLAALLNDPELRDDFRALIANLRTRGVLRYKDASASGAPVEPSRRQPFQPSRPPGR